MKSYFACSLCINEIVYTCAFLTTLCEIHPCHYMNQYLCIFYYFYSILWTCHSILTVYCLSIHLLASLVVQSIKSLLQCGWPGFDPWVGKNPRRRKWQPTPEFLPGEFHGQRSPWGHKESDTTEWLAFTIFIHLLMEFELFIARVIINKWTFL